MNILRKWNRRLVPKWVNRAVLTPQKRAIELEKEISEHDDGEIPLSTPSDVLAPRWADIVCQGEDVSEAPPAKCVRHAGTGGRALDQVECSFSDGEIRWESLMDKEHSIFLTSSSSLSI